MNGYCTTCKDWRTCRGFGWYQPSEIEAQFCFNQIFWIIRNGEALHEGIYPSDPRPSGYSGGGGSHFKAGAKFQKPNEIHGEFDRRLKRTGEKGKVLLHEILKLNAQSVGDLSQSAREALYYCAGKDAKRTNFATWLAVRNYKNKLKSYRNITATTKIGTC